MIRATQRPRRNVELNNRGEVGRSVEGKDFECEKSNFEVDAMMNWQPAKVIEEL